MRELYEAMSGKVRLLPWTSPEGRPCYLDSDGGFLADLADSIEEAQIGMGHDLLVQARAALPPAERALPGAEYRWWACRLAEALSDALHVAETRAILPRETHRVPDASEAP